MEILFKMKIINIKTKSKHYNIYIGHDIFAKLKKIIKKENIQFKNSLLIVDKKVPKNFIEKIKSNINSSKKIVYLFNGTKHLSQEG